MDTQAQEQYYCPHCLLANVSEQGQLCSICGSLPYCEACGIILGPESVSKDNPNRCESCLHYEDLIKENCVSCGAQLPKTVIIKGKRKLPNYVVRGNTCSRCNASSSIAARSSKHKGRASKYVGYLGLLQLEVIKGKVGSDAFKDAKEMNPHDVNY